VPRRPHNADHDLVGPVSLPLPRRGTSAMRPIDAEYSARELLGPRSDRWRHSAGVAHQAAELAERLGLDVDVLVSAAWLHDIGYADPLVVTGFHPLDGAQFLARHGWPMRVVGLVAQHSGAGYVAAARGLAVGLAAYPDEGGLMSDALTYADQIVGPAGDRMSPEERYAEMLLRRGPNSWNARVDHVRRPYLESVSRRVELHLERAPVLMGP
jgi:putative nucleotidyltransferase with HDIG domain